jgi:hypothetical protein
MSLSLEVVCYISGTGVVNGWPVYMT